MSKQTEALKLALEALEESLGYVQEEAENAQRLYGQYPARQARIQGLKDDARKHMDAITAIREALAEQCVCGEPDTFGTHRTDGPCLAEQPAQQQEPVAIVDNTISGHINWLCTFFPKQGTKLYTSPPASKPWVGLDRKEMLVIIDQQSADKRTGLPMFWRDQVLEAARAIEAKLREKNT